MGTQDETQHYTKVMSQFDPDGAIQLAAEEAIAAQLIDNNGACSRLEHTCWVIRRVAECFAMTAFMQVCAFPMDPLLDLVQEVYDYLGTWEKRLEKPEDGPCDEEAGQAGKDLLVIALAALHPEFVRRA